MHTRIHSAFQFQQLINIKLPQKLRTQCGECLCVLILDVYLQLLLSSLYFSFFFLKKFLACYSYKLLVTCLSVHCLQPAALSHRMFRLMLRTTPPSWWPGSVPVQCMTQPSTGTLSHTRSCRAKTSASRSTGPMETRMWYARSFYISPQNAEKQRLDV